MAEKSLAERFTSAVANITTLEVITRVGDFKVDFTGKSDPTVDLTGTSMTGGLYTRIDLVDGDTFNDLTPDMLEEGRAELRTFHQESVTAARDMVDARVQLIEKIAKWIAGEAGELIKSSATKPPAPVDAPKPPADGKK